ncbi:MATE family efflux transporter [Pseudoduganella sp. RAF53_2]|uniref:MATE family efflux transporter n=1 Tax=unclassified Pseudoduganella TaxID=2637179 RepID=UPI003F94E14C
MPDNTHAAGSTPGPRAPLDARTQRLLTAPVLPTLLRLAAPNMLVMLAQSSVGLIETYFVSRLGIDALAGLSMVFPVLILVQTMSSGAMGGAIISAVARALGQGRRERAADLAWYALAAALAFGTFTTVLLLTGGAALYRLMGGEGEVLRAALSYSHIVFGGAMLIWIFNLLAAVIRGTGAMTLPTLVVVGGAVALLPLSPALIFGFGPLPRLGVAGGAAAIVLYYLAGCIIFIWHLWRGKCLVRPAARPPRLHWMPLRDLLRVGAWSSIVGTSANLTIAGVTGFVALHGVSAVAGYGAGNRLEYMVIPLTFGLGIPISVLIATSLGAGDLARAARVTWTGAAVAFVICEVIGLVAALWPEAWIGTFGADPHMISTGVAYLHIAGPCYGFFGLGQAFYFAAQGRGQVAVPAFGAALRMVAALGGCWIAQRLGASVHWLFASVGLGMFVLAAVNVLATLNGGRKK